MNQVAQYFIYIISYKSKLFKNQKITFHTQFQIQLKIDSIQMKLNSRFTLYLLQIIFLILSLIFVKNAK